MSWPPMMPEPCKTRMRMATMVLARRRSRGLMRPEPRARWIQTRGNRWRGLARSWLPLWRPPITPTPRRIHGLSATQLPARKPSKFPCRHRKPQDNLPMRFPRSRTACGARRRDGAGGGSERRGQLTAAVAQVIHRRVFRAGAEPAFQQRRNHVQRHQTDHQPYRKGGERGRRNSWLAAGLELTIEQQHRSEQDDGGEKTDQ